MIRPLLIRGLRQHARLLGILILGLFLFELVLVWVSARIDMGPSFQQLLGSLLPQGMVDTLFSQFGFASFAGAVSFGYQHPLSLMAGIAMVMVMATLPAHERETGLLDLVLARPVPRTRYLWANAILVVLSALLPPVALLAGGAVGLALVEAPGAVTWARYIPSATTLALLLLSVGAYTLLFASGAKRRGTATALGVGITLLFYWLDVMGDFWDLLETARLLSPFHFFDPAVAATSGILPRDALVLGGFVVAATLGAFLNFSRQDL